MTEPGHLPANATWVEDPDDPRLEDYRDIRDRDLLGPDGRGGLFVGEQALTVRKMLALPGVTRSVLIAPNWADKIAPLAPRDVPVYVAPQATLEAVAGFRIHRGVLAVGYRPPAAKLTLDAAIPRVPGPATILVCERISNIDNIGLLFRNAAAFGIDGVVLSPGCHDPLYRKSLRVSIGHALTMPWARSDDWPADLDRLREEWNLAIVGAAIAPRAVPIDALPRPERVAVVVGPEYEGLPAATLARCDHVACIPMAAGVDSLNVGVASAIFLHRFTRVSRHGNEPT
jgi:tRNA G18 (ribose-2'-O)-methylase SpoU